MTNDKFSPEEKYIYDENPEISVGENLTWTSKILTVFPAFRNHNYRLYFVGQMISLIGHWLQIVAQGWLVFQLTKSAFLIGIVAAAATTPMLLFSLFGGVIIDRFNKQKILIITQTSSMILAFMLGILTVSGIIQVWEIILLAFLAGTVNAIDLPARQSFVVEMVGKKYLTSAIALNSGIFNAARVIGPTVSGFLIATVGIGMAFLLNGISYIATIVALYFIRAETVIPKIHPHPLRAIQDGVSYAARHSLIRTLLILTSIMAIFGWSYTTIMPVIAQNVFGQGAKGLGYLYAFSGIGALLGSFIVSAFSKKLNSFTVIFGGNLLFIFSVIAFTFTKSLLIAFPFLSLSGLGLILQMATTNSAIQHLVEDKFRGRVMSLYVLMFVGLFPLGSLQVGFLSEHFGTLFALRFDAVVILISSIIVFVLTRNLRKNSWNSRHKF